jgi:hypothetical protein
LANPGVEYLVYQPYAKPFSVHLPPGRYQYEWFNPSSNLVARIGSVVASGGEQPFTPPFTGDAVLYLHAAAK